MRVRSCLLWRAEVLLRSAQYGLYLMPGVVLLHTAVSKQFAAIDQRTPTVCLFSLWWCARCIERSAFHATKMDGLQR
ncbi:hypothetical protein SAMN05421553_0199 [Pseudomonas anguilliseptica]|uniref:Uncharacterized protein n=1 Tax=Pseudomonas anguilliseptica TaxID=53406 RepID=A0A1H4P5Z9_PSEAG|nr:hypothetical protein SAMN05421553_0199 [Pseudomonas anguilliseptica]